MAQWTVAAREVSLRVFDRNNLLPVAFQMATRHRLPRNRVRARGQLLMMVERDAFLHVRAEGRRFRGAHMLVCVARVERGGAGLGLTVSRKVGNAVVRNRLKRQLREILRTERSLLNDGYDHVVILSPRAQRANFVTLRGELTCLLSRARDWVSAKFC